MRSLRAQLMLSHLSVVGLMAIVMIGAIVNFFSLGKSFDSTMDEQFPAMSRAHLVLKAAYEIEASLPVNSVGAADDTRLSRGIEDLQRAATRTDRKSLSAKELADYTTINENLKDLRIVTDIKRWDRAKRDVLEIEQVAASLFSDAQRQVQAAGAMTQTNAAGAFLRSILVTVFALIVASLLAFRLMKLALTPLALIAKHADMIATGDLSTQIDLSRRDEVGKLADSFNAMASRLSEMRRSEVRRLRRAQLMSDIALESLYDPVIVTDAKGRIRNLNRAAQGLFGAAPDSPRRHIAQHIEDERIIHAVERAISSQQSSATEDENSQINIQVGASDRTYRIRAAPMRDDKQLIGCVVVLEDITHLKVLDQMKTEFIAVASHELRTPVTSLLLSTQLLEEGAAGQLNEDQQQIVQAQREDLERLRRLMSDILDLSRLEAGATPPRLEVFPAEELFGTLKRDFQLLAAEKEVELEFAISPADLRLRADRGQFHRAISNLISNAIRHTPTTGKVSVSAKSAENEVIFCVEDTGEGIPPEFLTRIFDRFVQVPGRAQGGAGLGLAIVQSIVRSHGGTLRVESEVGRGTRFYIQLPMPPESISSEPIHEGAIQ